LALKKRLPPAKGLDNRIDQAHHLEHCIELK